MDQCALREASEVRIIVFGSRSWADRSAVFGRIEIYAKIGPCVIVHGNCPTGADYYAELAAIQLGCEIERFTADWETYGRAAGPIRNRDMALAGADIALGFRSQRYNHSPGTDGMRRLLEKAGIPVELYGEGWK